MQGIGTIMKMNNLKTREAVQKWKREQKAKHIREVESEVSKMSQRTDRRLFLRYNNARKGLVTLMENRTGAESVEVYRTTTPFKLAAVLKSWNSKIV